jgi:adenylate cyclase
MSATLEEMFNKASILDVSFFNFENAITAAYFADAELNIVKANKNFKALFPNIKNI